MLKAAAPKVMWGSRARTFAFWLLAVLVAVSIGLLLTPGPAHADTTIRVNSMGDTGDNNPGNGTCAIAPFPVGTEPNCTLRAAIQEANVNGVSDTITFDSFLSGSITLTLGQLEIANDTPAKDLIIEGPGARKITISGNDASGVFVIKQFTEVTISGLTIGGGNSNNINGGGGIRNSGTLELTNSTVSGNSATERGGGISSGLGTLRLTNTTVSGNTAPMAGGIYNVAGMATLTNSTVSGNIVTGNTFARGGGIFNDEAGILELANSTVSGNTVHRNTTINSGGFGGGISNADGTVRLTNTIIARNTAPTDPDAQGEFNSQGNNLIGDTTGATGFVASDLKNVEPLLGPLRDNGGPTRTHALLAGSPAVDKGR